MSDGVFNISGLMGQLVAYRLESFDSKPLTYGKVVGGYLNRTDSYTLLVASLRSGRVFEVSSEKNNIWITTEEEAQTWLKEQQ